MHGVCVCRVDLVELLIVCGDQLGQFVCVAVLCLLLVCIHFGSNLLYLAQNPLVGMLGQNSSVSLGIGVGSLSLLPYLWTLRLVPSGGGRGGGGASVPIEREIGRAHV